MVNDTRRWGEQERINSVHGCTCRKANLAPYEEGGWGAWCTCSARASVLNASFSDLGSISSTWHVARAAPSRLAKKFARTYRSNGRHHRPQTHRSHAYCTNLKSIGGAVPVGCRLHPPGAENLFDEGSFGFRKPYQLKILWGCYLCGVPAARARGGKPLFERGPPVLRNFELLTPNLVHLWNSMSLIRWYVLFRDRVHSAHAMHVLYAFA